MRIPRSGFVFLAVALFCLGLSAVPAEASILTFDIRYDSNSLYWGADSLMTYFSPLNSASTPPNAVPYYGDHVTGAAQDLGSVSPDGSDEAWYDYGNAGEGYTPNIGVSYSSTDGAPGGGFLTYNDSFWPRVAELQTVGKHYYITFTPDAGYLAQINSFALRSYGASPPTQTVNWTIWEGTIGGTVFASSKSDGSGQAGGTAQSFSFNNTGGSPFLAVTNAGPGPGMLILDIDFASGSSGNLSLDDVNFQQVAPEPASLALLCLGGLSVLSPRRR